MSAASHSRRDFPAPDRSSLDRRTVLAGPSEGAQRQVRDILHDLVGDRGRAPGQELNHPERDETLNILADLVDLSRGPKTASANSDKVPVQQRP